MSEVPEMALDVDFGMAAEKENMSLNFDALEPSRVNPACFSCGSAADLPPDWQPLVSTWTSGTVGGHIAVWFSAPYEERFIIFPLPLQNIHTFLSHSSQASPVLKHFITILLLLTFFPFNNLS